MELSWTPEAADLRDGLESRRRGARSGPRRTWSARTSTILLMIAFVLVVLVASVAIGLHDYPRAVLAVVLAGLILVRARQKQDPDRLSRTLFDRYERARQPARATVSPDGVTSWTETSSRQRAWSDVVEVLETARSFVLVVPITNGLNLGARIAGMWKRRAAFVLPKRAVGDPGRIPELRQLLETHTGRPVVPVTTTVPDGVDSLER